MTVLRLKKQEDRRIKHGHLWVYSNEIDIQATPLKGMTPGQVVDIQNARGEFLARAYANPSTLLCARVLTYDIEQQIDEALLEQRIARALALRERCFPGPFYRLIYGEGDFLPGLVVDRYGDVLSAQLTTAGMELLKDKIAAALIKVIKPKALVWRNDHSMRETEGLASYVETAYGSAVDAVQIVENGTKFLVPVLQGQKTGWFYDHGDNRRRMLPFIKNKRVLDVFSYLGAWGIQALNGGASEVWAIDSSASALELSKENARLNGVQDRYHCLQGDAFEQLKSLQERFDVVLLDPPAFIKRKKDKKEGLLAYQRIVDLAMRVLNKEGMLIVSSCSLHLEVGELVDAVNRASHHGKRFTSVLVQGHQNVDHPVHPMIPETNYIKSLFCKTIQYLEIHSNLI
jgi:23S rRNA (cytosine1962-C5)-methyltransferase